MHEPLSLRSLPAIGALLARPRIAALVEAHGHARVTEAARRVVERAREALRAGHAATVTDDDVVRALADEDAAGLREVINATGVLVHTNLGRVPLARAALDAIARTASDYASLELDLATGERGHRHAHVVPLLRALTSAEDALVVNNNAAAVLLALGACAAGKAAIVSRGELVEIGGGFRIPEVVVQSGAHLVEVGTTNRTHAADYERAIDERTAVLLKVHRSNFEQRGFVAEVDVAGLAAIARARGLVTIVDAGSGCLPRVAARVGERAVNDELAAGADLVCVSGDKLLGGPQAGIVVGRSDLIEKMRRAPLYRALRPDKLTLAALAATLTLWRERPEELPIVRMLDETDESLVRRAARVLGALHHAAGAEVEGASIVATEARVGGGAAPSLALPSRAIALAGRDATALAARLRMGSPAVVARIEDGALLVDLRTVPEEREAALVRALAEALASASTRS
jgi:L-seryl-tRNA(Ser) seleniumtransferase